MTMTNKLGLLLILAMTACGEGEDDEHEGGVASDLCASGTRWAGGNEESPQMHPGYDCIGCHTAEREGPRFSIAGTVHATLDEPDDCFGVPGVAVTIIGADDQSIELVTNSAGNFYASATMTLPIRVRLAFDGREAVMQAPQTTGACATCHTSTGTNLAPGRIVAP